MTTRHARISAAEVREQALSRLGRQRIITLTDAGLRIQSDIHPLDEEDLRRLAGLIKARLMEMPCYPDIPFWSVAPGETIATTAPLQRSRVKTAATRVRMQAAREWGRENVVIEHRGGEFFVTRRDRRA